MPHLTCFVAVPDGVDIDVACTRTCLETIETLPVYPAPLDSVVSEHGMTWIDEFFRKDTAAYSSTQWYPSATAELAGEFRLRDQRVAIVDVYPVQYLASEDSLRVWGDVSVDVEFSGGTPVWNQAGLGHYDRVVGNMLIGYVPSVTPMDMTPSPGSVFRHVNTAVQPATNPDYVIMVAAGLDGNHVTNFANYRSSLNGFDVLIANVEDIITGYGTPGSTFISPEILRSYTEALWDWSSPGDRPTYLLLIGDHDYSTAQSYSYCLPAKENGSTEGPANDEWLVLFDEPSGEFSGLPDMIVGRLPVRDADTLEDIFDLIEGYESAATPPYPENLQNRRWNTRLAGTDNDGATFDVWNPSSEWTTAMCDWLGYSLDDYYCGDGEDTFWASPPNPDNSRFTSAQWVAACTEVFERGSHIAFYSDHGDFHMFSAGLNWEEGGPVNFGLPDSAFNDLNVAGLVPDSDHWFPFILMLCCSSGTFNHTQDEHESISTYPCLCSDRETRPPDYDFESDCLAEDFILNTDCGAIGVFASSNLSFTDGYGPYGEGFLKAVHERGITRVGDAILSARLQGLDYFYNGGVPHENLARFNLLGDPAVDIGDRMKFRDHCDLIICPDDIAMNKYPTMGVDGNSSVTLRTYVRNAGWLAAGPFTVSIEVSDGSGSSDILTRQCTGLAPGEEKYIEFQWNNTWFTPPGSLYLTASASDPGGQTPDSWMPNNSAEVQFNVKDFYPNESGWPVDIGESVLVPPVLCDFDGNPSNGLEIVLATENDLVVYDEDFPTAPIWQSNSCELFSPYGFEVRPSIPVAGNILGGKTPEVVIDTRYNLYVYNSTSRNPVLTFNHPQGWFRETHTVSMGDFVSESDLAVRDEIVVIRDNELQILDVVGSSLVPLRTRTLPGVSSSSIFVISWSALQDLNNDGTPEIIVRARWELLGGTYGTEYLTYDFNSDSFTSQRSWQEKWSTIPAVGALPSGFQVAIPTDQSTSSYNPAWLVDPDNLQIEQSCASNPDPMIVSHHVPYCVMADWDPLVAGADRVIANTENQCYAWDEQGLHVGQFPKSYNVARDTDPPPFPALGELDDQDSHDYADVLVATANGVVFGFSSVGAELINLGFPYTLPSSIQGGFTIADIDRDGKVEVVFGTMDNHLHVWELGSCSSGYAPWPQCQHDAARTGVLVE